MVAALAILNLLLYLLFLLLMLRLVLDWVQSMAQQWRPRGAALVVASAVYSLTDPPVRALRRWIPPLRFGAVSLDMSFLVLLLVLGVLRALVSGALMGMMV